MQTMKLNLFGDNEKSLSVTAGSAENTNCYQIATPAGRNGVALAARMGRSLHATLTTKKCRGATELKGKGYVLSGTKFYQIDRDGNAVQKGSIAGTDPIYMTTDGTSVIMVNGTTTGYYYNTESDAFNTISLPYEAYSATYLDGYMAFSSSGQRWFISEVNDSDSFNALDFAEAEKSADDLLSIWEDHGELILFGEKTIEPWFNSGSVDFAFQRNSAGIIERGVLGRWAITKSDNTVFFLGDDLIVYRMEGYRPVRISDLDVEKRLSDYAKDDRLINMQGATMFSYTEHGHKFIQLNIPDVISLCYNVATQEWFTVKHYDYETDMATCYFQIDKRHYIGGLDGNVYFMSPDIHDDAGRPMFRGRRTQIFSNNDQISSWKKIKFVMDFGSTPIVDNSHGTEPVLMVRWSYDNGKTWRSQKFLTIGVQGDYLAKAIKRGCGASRSRILEFGVTDPVPFFVVDAFAEIH